VSTGLCNQIEQDMTASRSNEEDHTTPQNQT